MRYNFAKIGVVVGYHRSLAEDLIEFSPSVTIVYH